MAERNYFQKLGPNDYKLFMKYYTQIEYSYFRKDDPRTDKEEKTRILTLMTELISPRRIPKEGFLELLKQGDSYLYYGENGEVLGIVMVTPSASHKKLIIQEFFVLKRFQGHHIGTQMYKDFLYFLKDEGYFKVSIELLCSFEGSEVFWKKMGYRLFKTKFESATGAEYRWYSKEERPNRLPSI